jgi:hypothetical protein
MSVILVTGSAGLIGSEAVRFFFGRGFTVVGIDNDMRRIFWRLSILVSVVFILASAAAALSGFLRCGEKKHYQSLGILLLFGNMAIFSLAMGWGRAGLVPQVGLPDRYVLLSVPAFLTAFFIWEIYGSPNLRSLVQSGLFFIMCLMLPFNMAAGSQEKLAHRAWTPWSGTC